MTEIQNNLFGIKWPTGVDMPLNKTQTQTQTLNLQNFGVTTKHLLSELNVFFLLLHKLLH